LPTGSARSQPDGVRPVGAAKLLSRRWLTLLLTVIIVVGAAVGYSLYRTKSYKATAVVYLNPIDLANQVAGAALPATDSLSLARSAQTQADIAVSPQIAASAVALSGERGISPRILIAETTVVPVNNADLLDFTVTDSSATRAIKLADSYVQAYTTALVDLDTAPIERAIVRLQTRINSLGTGGAGHQALYSNLVERVAQLQSLSDLETSNASVVQRPTSASAAGTRLAVTGILALVVGLILGTGFMLVREQVDQRMRVEEEIDDALGLQLLGKLAPPRVPRSWRGPRLITFTDPNGYGAEEFRILRANLDFVAAPGASPRAFLFTSAQAAEGKSTTVANLAVTLARLGKRTLILDLDFRHPSQAAMFGVESRYGIADVMRGDVELDRAIGKIGVGPETSARGAHLEPSVHLLSTGVIPVNVGDFLALPNVSAIIKELRLSGLYDYLLIDTSPMVQFADARSVLGVIDGLVIVARLNQLTRSAARELRRLVKMTETTCLGYVLTGSQDQMAKYAYGYNAASAESVPATTNSIELHTDVV
jgi:succinoglycan biosynthesis transport protein ExoP